MNNEEIEPSLKKKIYKETLNQLAKTMPSYKDDDVLATTWEDANTELYVIEVEDIKNAINFAINKTYAEASSNTAKEIFKELDKIKCKGNHKGSATYDNDKYMDVIHVEDYEALKKKYKVD